MKTNFGFKKVLYSEKEPKVQKVFSDVAKKYDMMNDIMSFGFHRLWKDKFLNNIDVFCDKTLLDIAGGTGDIAMKFIDKGGARGIVYDLNECMLEEGRNKVINKGFLRYNDKIEFIKGNGHSLPYQDNLFDYCSIAFGIRNVTDINMLLRESLRVLKVGGKFLCLEFMRMENSRFSSIYNKYILDFIPKLGSIFANDYDSYRYLAESIKSFYSAEEFSDLMKEAGYVSVNYKLMSFGIVAIHYGYKL